MILSRLSLHSPLSTELSLQELPLLLPPLTPPQHPPSDSSPFLLPEFTSLSGFESRRGERQTRGSSKGKEKEREKVRIQINQLNKSLAFERKKNKALEEQCLELSLFNRNLLKILHSYRLQLPPHLASIKITGISLQLDRQRMLEEELLKANMELSSMRVRLAELTRFKQDLSLHAQTTSKIQFKKTKVIILKKKDNNTKVSEIKDPATLLDFTRRKESFPSTASSSKTIKKIIKNRLRLEFQQQLTKSVSISAPSLKICGKKGRNECLFEKDQESRQHLLNCYHQDALQEGLQIIN